MFDHSQCSNIVDYRILFYYILLHYMLELSVAPLYHMRSLKTVVKTVQSLCIFIPLAGHRFYVLS